jgi:hypothetical protein
MAERPRWLVGPSPETLGGVLVFIGLMLFIVVFLAVFPVLTDPVGTYDDWFPETDEPLVQDDVPEEESAEEPTAAFRFTAEAVTEEPPDEVGEEGGEEGEGEPLMATYQVRFEDRSEPGDAAITSWTWDLGDGSEARGRVVEYTYEGPGEYVVRLDIEDDSGVTARVEADVEVPEEGRAFGRADSADDLDLSGIESALEDAVGTLETSAEDALDEIGLAARRIVIVVLFALAAIATTVIAWRVTRSGIFLLRGPEKVRLNVESADMDVRVGKQPLADLVEEYAPELADVGQP